MSCSKFKPNLVRIVYSRTVLFCTSVSYYFQAAQTVVLAAS